MKSRLSFVFCVLLQYITFSVAYPGMQSSISSIHQHAKRFDTDGSKELLGDLKTLKDSQLTAVGKEIKGILLGTGSAESTTIDNSIPASLGSTDCSANTCCVWRWVSFDMLAKFKGTGGRCTRFARMAVRLGFHDAGGWSNTSSYGGADGSILLTDEINRVDNNGLKDVGDWMRDVVFKKYSKYGITMADLIQFGANVATVVCPLGPRVKTYVGRKDNAKAAPTGLLPDANDSADKLIKLFQAKTISPHDLVALVGAHTTSQQHFVDTTRDGDPQDSTPGVWDVAFYPQTLQNPPARVMKFASDIKLSQDSRTKDEWQEFVGDQNHWNEDYSASYVRLSLLGVNNINNLVDCTKVLPAATTSFASPDQAVLDLWLSGDPKYDFLSQYVDAAELLTGVSSSTSGG